MRNLIKIAITLFFILGSYFLGHYHASEEYLTQLKDLNEKLSKGESSIKQLKDSIGKITTYQPPQHRDTIIAEHKQSGHTRSKSKATNHK
jgi:hypothetical protein